MRKTVFAPEILQSISGLIRDPLFYFLLFLCTVLTTVVYGLTPMGAAVIIFSLFACALAVIDLRHFLLPDILVLGLLVSGLMLSPWAFGLPWQAAIAGILVGFLFFWLIRFIMSRILKQESLGFGDVKLLAALGAWLGLINLPPLLLIACLLALPFSLIQRWKTPDQPHIPFGPALLAGALATLLFPAAGWQIIFNARQSLQSIIQGFIS